MTNKGHAMGSAGPLKAAQYVRMSTEHQRYSVQNQMQAIQAFASQRGIEIVGSYADEGRSGLSLDGRPALKQLIAAVTSDEPGFDAILVYDISRWGRFQDADESAYYEYICRRAGVAVHYCAEPFENDGSPISTILKGVKRLMAGEYSRELSAKVFAGQRRLIELGYRQGGVAGFGFRRLLIDEHGNPKCELARGQKKSIQTDRVVLAIGPRSEVRVVRQIYRAFVVDGWSERHIARWLNERGILSNTGRPWRGSGIHQILSNEKYVGNNVWNRLSSKLQKRRVRNTPEAWIRGNGAFPAIIDRATFDAAQTIIREKTRRRSDEEMLSALRDLWSRSGKVTVRRMGNANNVPSQAAYAKRFGNILNAYRLIGYPHCRDFSYIEANRARKLRLETIDGEAKPLTRRMPE